MWKSRSSEELKIAVVQQQGAAGGKITELCPKHGITETTIYRCRAMV